MNVGRKMQSTRRKNHDQEVIQTKMRDTNIQDPCFRRSYLILMITRRWPNTTPLADYVHPWQPPGPKCLWRDWSLVSGQPRKWSPGNNWSARLLYQWEYKFIPWRWSFVLSYGGMPIHLNHVRGPTIAELFHKYSTYLPLGIWVFLHHSCLIFQPRLSHPRVSWNQGQEAWVSVREESA